MGAKFLVMKIESRFENCSYSAPYLVNESGDGKVELEIELETIVSLQSPKAQKDTLTNSIRQELSKYEWLISGLVSIELHWYLSHQDRHETDKGSDLDNMTKPIIDALVGETGLLVDDSQIKSLYVDWISKNQSKRTSLLVIWINFINDFSLNKRQLFFVQYHKAICSMFDVDLNDLKNLIAVKLIIWTKIKSRRLSGAFFGTDQFYLTYSTFDFHRTRLQNFSKTKIFTIFQFNQICKDKGLTFKKLLIEMRKMKLKDNSP